MEHSPPPNNATLKNLRITRSLSQNEVAEAIGTNANTVSRWERGIATPSMYYRRKLAELFEVDPQALFFDLNGGTDKTTMILSPVPEATGDLPNQTEDASPIDQITAELPPDQEISGDLPHHTEDTSPITTGHLQPETTEDFPNTTEDGPQGNHKKSSAWRKVPRWLYIPVAIIMIFILILGGILVFITRTPPDLFPALCSGPFQSTNTSITPTPATTTAPDGKTIGLSEGATILIFSALISKRFKTSFRLPRTGTTILKTWYPH